jgi:hypothetical protein
MRNGVHRTERVGTDATRVEPISSGSVDGPNTEPGSSLVKARPKLRGTVTKLTFRRLKDGRVRHWTHIDFEQPSDFKSVAVSGAIAAEHDPETRLLDALRERYDVPGLPQARWSR